MRVRLPSDDPPHPTLPIAVMVRSGGRHIGILHKDDSQTYFLHLERHFKLTNEEASKKFDFCTAPSIPVERANVVAAYCRRVFNLHSAGRVPYGFSPPATFFDENGEISLSQGNIGLTCATFVLAVFNAAGLQVLDYSTWPHRASDCDFQDLIISLMQQGQFGDASEAHIDKVRKNRGALRFKPIEVAGALAGETYPVAFDAMNAIKGDILKLVGLSEPL